MGRYFHIDFVRALAIVIIIATHVFSYNLSTPLIQFLWNYSHFTVAAFVLCSGYVLFARYGGKIHTLQDIVQFYKKRLFRLLIPFYIYLCFHSLLMFLFPLFFNGLGISLSPEFYLQSITLVGGINLNWLPLLFLELAVLFPILILFGKNKKIQIVFIAVLLVVTVFTTIWIIPYAYYRWTMWISWLVVFLFSFFLFQKQQQHDWKIAYSFGLAATFFILWVLLYILWQHVGRPINLIDNKYPPNWYSLSFELFGTSTLLGFGSMPVYPVVVKRVILFLSTSSYNLFFIHYIVLDFVLSLKPRVPILTSSFLQLAVVLILSCGIALVLSRFQKLFAR